MYYRKYEDRICVTCGNTFNVRTDSYTTHCSYKCAQSNRKTYKACEYCGNEFVAPKSKSRFCSADCSNKSRRKRTILKCCTCGKQFEKQPSQIGDKWYCSKACADEGKKLKEGEHSPKWKGGIAHMNGYIFIKQPNGRYKQEHRIIAEETLGRKLDKEEVVHHINRVKTDNRPENLQVMTREEHIELHRREG